MANYSHILDILPYTAPFLFVDQLISVSEEGASGVYTFKQDEYFYKGHFIDNPVTPGVILTECMAQIGVVCLGIYLMSLQESATENEDKQIALSSVAVDYLVPVYPGETVTVRSEKKYFRFGKLKCNVSMRNAKNELVCKGTISGMMG
jgi:3-hydroxyacyl-[acyl-carrier-protein] dehydratase